MAEDVELTHEELAALLSAGLLVEEVKALSENATTEDGGAEKSRRALRMAIIKVMALMNLSDAQVELLRHEMAAAAIRLSKLAGPSREGT